MLKRRVRFCFHVRGKLIKCFIDLLKHYNKYKLLRRHPFKRFENVDFKANIFSYKVEYLGQFLSYKKNHNGTKLSKTLNYVIVEGI